MEKLTTTKLDNLAKAGTPGRHADPECPGLYFKVTGVKTASWVFRFRLFGKRPEIGLGTYPTVGLAVARAMGRSDAKLVADGIDPRKHRGAVQSKQKADAAKPRTIAELAAAYLKVKGWDPPPHYEDDNHGYSTCLRLRKHILPALDKGNLLVEHIDGDQILKLIKPMWGTKPAQAREVYHLITELLDYAIEVPELISINPARRIRRYLDTQPDGGRMTALPWQQIPELIAKLRNFQRSPRTFHPEIDTLTRISIIAARKRGVGIAEICRKFNVSQGGARYICKTGKISSFDTSLAIVRAIEMVIHSALRTKEVRLMQWKEIDSRRQVLIIPRARMKIKKGGDFDLPLTQRMIEIFAEMKAISEGGDYIFPGEWRANKTLTRTGKDKTDPAGFPLGSTAMIELLQRTLEYDVTMHGFRSTFSDWAYDQKRFSVFAIEYSLDHIVHGKISDFGSAIAGRYHRDRYLEERRELLEAWGNFCCGNLAEIIPLRQVPEHEP